MRIEELRKNLLRYTDDLYTENHSMFEMHIQNLAREKLAPAAFGPVMLTTLGRVYQLQAKRSRWNMGAYFKCAYPHNTCLMSVFDITHKLDA